MKAKIDLRILTIITLIIILGIMCYFYFKNNSNQITDNFQFGTNENASNTGDSSNKSNITGTSDISSGLTENLELHATYYLEESYVQANQLVKSGEKILKYTNGTYLTAPYDCVITKINIPEEQAKCTNDHYIQISSNHTLMVQFKVDESKIDTVSLGEIAIIEISAYENKSVEGTVTKISSTASNGKFTVTVEFENDGEIMIGMTANITVK